MYKELEQLKSKQRKAHILDAPMLDDTENYMVSLTDLGDPGMSFGVTLLDIVPKVNIHATGIHQDVALLDSATTHDLARSSLL